MAVDINKIIADFTLLEQRSSELTQTIAQRQAVLADVEKKITEAEARCHRYTTEAETQVALRRQAEVDVGQLQERLVARQAEVERLEARVASLRVELDASKLELASMVTTDGRTV